MEVFDVTVLFLDWHFTYLGRSPAAANGSMPHHIWWMTKPPPGNRTKTHSRSRNPAEPPRFHSPIRVSIDREALAAIDKQALGAQVG